MKMYGPRHESGILPWAKCQIFLKTFFNDIEKNLNKKFHLQLSYHSFKLLFLFSQICAISTSKKFEKEKWPKVGYLPLSIAMTHGPYMTVCIQLHN